MGAARNLHSVLLHSRSLEYLGRALTTCVQRYQGRQTEIMHLITQPFKRGIERCWLILDGSNPLALLQDGE